MISPGEGTPDMPAAVKRIVLDQQTINRRVAELACQISNDYGPEDLLMVGILEGARTFVQDLARHLPGALPPDFIQTTRYGRPDTSEEIQIVRDVGQEIASRDVLLVQSIVDTGAVSTIPRSSPTSLP